MPHFSGSSATSSFAAKKSTKRREELQELKTLSQQSSPQALAECLAVAATFLNEVKATRDAAKEQPRVVAGELFANTRRAVHDTYQSIRFAPSRIKHYLMQKRNHAVDRVLQNVAHVIDQGAKSLVERRDTILQSSPLAIEHEFGFQFQTQEPFKTVREVVDYIGKAI